MRMTDLAKRLEDRLFKPFRIHLSDGTLLDVREPGMIVVGLSSAIIPTKFGKDPQGYRYARDWQTIALSHIVRFTDIPQRANGRRRTRS